MQIIGQVSSLPFIRIATRCITQLDEDKSIFKVYGILKILMNQPLGILMRRNR